MGKKIRRLIAVLLIITSVMIMCMPGESPYASVQKGDFEIEGNTLVKYTGNSDILTLPNTIQTIGKDAFSGNDRLLKVTIPDSVRNIDFAAFENCKNLMQVVIPESVRAIGSSAYSGCENLQYINIPSKCEQIGSAAFAKCPKLSTISVSPKSSSYICVDGVLYTRDGKKLIQYLAGRTRSSYNMPSSVEAIEEYAFWGASQLADISISSKIKEIPEYAFSNCSGLNNVVLPYKVESLMPYSFADCYSLTTMVLPDSCGYIDKNAFYLTDNVTLNYYDADEAEKKIENEGVPEELFLDYVDSVSSNSYNISIDGSAGEKSYIKDMPYVSSMTPDYSDSKTPGELASSKIVGGKAVLMLSRSIPVKGFDVNAAESEDGIPSYDDISYTSGDGRIIAGVYAGGGSVSGNTAVESGVRRIGNRAFYKETGLENVSLPSTLESIGDFAFARTGLKSVNIPDGTSSIGYAAFYNSTDLQDVTIPSSVETIELGAFDGTPWLERALKDRGDGDFLTVGDGILLGYRGNGGRVDIPSGVKYIAPGSFEGNEGITEVTFPDSLTVIGEEAFSGCTLLDNVILPETVERIEDRAFKDCRFRQITIPSSVREIGLGAFERNGMNASDDPATVIFKGNKLPMVSYKNTATRLSADNLRKLSFAGFDNAVVGPEADMDSANVLSVDEYGFRGQVYRITADASEGRGELRLIRSFSEGDEAGDVVIDSHVPVAGSDYLITSVSDTAFEPYSHMDEWTDRKIRNVSIRGNASDDLNGIVERVNNEISALPADQGSVEDGSIKVYMDSSISPDKDEPEVKITGGDNRYHINISDASDREDISNEALIARYGGMDGISAVPLNITMYDDISGVPIKRLSGRKVDMELPIPTAFTQAADISVGAVDDNGELTELAAEIVNHGGNDKIRFVAPHFSVYVFYTRDVTETVLEMETSAAMAPPSQNAVFQTLNRNVFHISLKWYVGIVLLIIAAILLLYRGKGTGLQIKLHRL